MPDQATMTRAEFAAKIKAQYPVYASIPDDELATKMLAKYPIYGSQIQDATGPSSAAPASDQSPGWAQRHPNVAALTRGTLDTLPAVGGVVGGLLATPETFGAGTVAGAGLGFGAGRGLRDLIAEGLGLDAPSSVTQKAANIATDAVLGAATGEALPGAPKVAVTAGKALEHAGEQLTKDFMRPATFAGVIGAITRDPTAAAVTEAAPYAMKYAGRGLQRVGAALGENPQALAIAKLRARMAADDLAKNPQARAALASAIKRLGGVP